MYIRFGKRFVDFLVSSLVLVVLTPLLLVVSIILLFKLGTPILFRQERPGLNGIPFTFYKFRTMTNERDSCGNLLPDLKRLTPFGRFLRKTSLDELPSLWNVLNGDMSIVGPRPLLVDYLDLYSPEQARRHEVKPGITGLAQVNGRNLISWEEKFEYDVYYVDNYSFLLDLKILLLTITKVFKRSGISHHGYATMPEFLGRKATKKK